MTTGPSARDLQGRTAEAIIKAGKLSNLFESPVLAVVLQQEKASMIYDVGRKRTSFLGNSGVLSEFSVFGFELVFLDLRSPTPRGRQRLLLF